MPAKLALESVILNDLVERESACRWEMAAYRKTVCWSGFETRLFPYQTLADTCVSMLLYTIH